MRFLLPSIKFPAVSDDCRACSLTWQGESAFIMADELVGSLATQSPTTQLQSFAEDSVYEDLSIELPDLEETQIIDNEEDQVSVF